MTSFFSPGGGDHDDGPRVDQLCVEERAPAAAVQVGALDHIGVGIHPEHQPALRVHSQTLWADQICTVAAGEGRNMEISGFEMLAGVLLLGVGFVLCTCADEGLGLGSRGQRGSADGPGRQVGPVHSVFLAVEGNAHNDGALKKQNTITHISAC